MCPEIRYRFTQLLLFCDDGDFKSLIRRDSSDVYLFAALGVDATRASDLEKAFALLKESCGLPPQGPVKYNMRDTKVVRWYADRQLRNVVDLFREQHVPKFRGRLYELLQQMNCFVLAAGKKAFLGPEKKPENPTLTKSYAFCNLLQRLGMLAKYNLARRDSTHPRVQMTVDTPSEDFRKEPFDIYAAAWQRGWCGSALGQDFICGPLGSIGFSKTLLQASTLNTPLLQIADIMTGAIRDFLNYCFEFSEGVANRVNTQFLDVLPILHRDDDYASRYRKELRNSEVFSGLHLSPKGLCKLVDDKLSALKRVRLQQDGKANS